MPEVFESHLVKAIVDLAVFLEFSPEAMLSQDAAVGAMEQLAAELGLMSNDDKHRFALLTKDMATAYGERSYFVLSLPNSLGLE